MVDTQAIQFGAEFYINLSDTRANTFRHFELMKEYGFTLARVFVVWHHIEPQPGVWDFTRYDCAYEAAQANGISVACTLFPEDPPGWRGLSHFTGALTNLNEPDVRAPAAEYIERVVTHFKEHPAQGPWLLMNEPSLHINYDASTMKRFGEWLRVKYGTVEAWNRRWFRQFERFEDVVVSPEQWQPFFCCYPSFIDWQNFCSANLCDHLAWIKELIRKHDTVHPTHANPHGLAYNTMQNGQDFWREAKLVEFMGASIHPSWHFRDVPREQFGLLYAYHCDMTRSFKKGTPWWVTELQGGTTIYTGLRPLNPTPGEITRWLWDAVGAGAKAVVYWLWHAREGSREAGEWGLLNLAGHPSARLEATQRVAGLINSTGSFLAEASAQPAKVAILYSRQTMVVNAIDGTLQKREEDYIKSVLGCYKALRQNHVPVDFLDDDELKAGVAQQYEVLYLPYVYALDDESVQAIRNYVEKGGTVWADGLPAWKDEYGRPRPQIPGGLAEVFGCDVEEIAPTWAPFSLTGEDKEAGESWLVSLRVLEGAEPVLWAENAGPVATRNSFGKGEAVFVGTALTLGYYSREESAAARWIAAPALAKGLHLPVNVIGASPAISFRGMVHPSGARVAVLTNWGPATVVTVRLQGHFDSVMELTTGATVETSSYSESTTATVSLEAGGVRVIIAR